MQQVRYILPTFLSSAILLLLILTSAVPAHTYAQGATDTLSRILSGHTDYVYSVAWSPDGKSLASASRGSIVRLWDAAGGHSLRTLSKHMGIVSSVAWSLNSKTLA